MSVPRRILFTTRTRSLFPGIPRSSRILNIPNINTHSHYSTSQQKTQSTFEAIKDSFNYSNAKNYPIPFGLGLLVIGVLSYRRISKRESERLQSILVEGHTPEDMIAIEGPWHVHVISTLPFRSLSRLWGYLCNDLEWKPTWLKRALLKTYAWSFGCNLDEMKQPDLDVYKNLGDFFYRELKDGARKIDNIADLVSPSDGKILAFGQISAENHISQIKGKSYSVASLLGSESKFKSASDDETVHVTDSKHFADINYIEYSLQDLIGEDPMDIIDHKESLSPTATSSTSSTTVPMTKTTGEYTDLQNQIRAIASGYQKHSHNNELFYCVIYLAPGDYHRFHSPTEWLIEKRRHFYGELFSVSPTMVSMLQNLFVLNERVALLGKWRHGFFSMTPVGATNVGSIVLDFDPNLKTNLKEDDKKALVGKWREKQYKSTIEIKDAENSGGNEETKKLSIQGYPLIRGAQMGGFKLGSTVVLVFEGPAMNNEGNQQVNTDADREEWVWTCKTGETVRMGQPLGYVKRV